MSGLYQLKPAFQNQLRPLVSRLASVGITANQVTISAVFISCLAGGAIAVFRQSSWLFLIPIVLLIRMALNAIDGMLAREYGMKTPLGAILNELGDVISDAVLYLPFGLIPGINSPWIVLIVILAIIGEMAGVLGIVIGGQRRYDGFMGKSDRALIFSIIALLLAAGVAPATWLDILLVSTMVLLVQTIYSRIRNNFLEIENNDLGNTTK
jgi:CDP-diacylglycerol---glycerol-3-phosphate 3-phosphatidyltransferase